MADLLAAVTAIAAEAGQLAIDRWSTGFRRWEKSPGDPVSEVDLEVDALLRQRLTALMPGAGWLSEESVDSQARLACAHVWIVDPIDGTRDYLRQRPGWAVSIALVERGAPVLAVLDAPARAERWAAAMGQGATLNDVPIMVSRRVDLAGARVPTDALPKIDRDLVAVAKPNSIALRIAMVAAGEADLVAALRWGHDWDLAAAALIAHEAGATVTDALGKPLRFNTPRAAPFGILATAPGIHAAAVDWLRDRAVAGLGKR